MCSVRTHTAESVAQTAEGDNHTHIIIYNRRYAVGLLTNCGFRHRCRTTLYNMYNTCLYIYRGVTTAVVLQHTRV